MLVQANISFAGTFSMYAGEIRECNDNIVLHDLLNCKYVEEVKQGATTKGGKNESKRNNSK